MRSKLASIARFFLFSSKCILCSQTLTTDDELCSRCYELLPFAKNYCVHCGVPLPQTSLQDPVCGRCLLHPLPFNRTVCTFWYKEPLQTLLIEYKFNRKLFLARILACLMAEKIMEYYLVNQLTLPQCLIPVPLHSKRLAQRGYNQAGELTKYLSQILGITYSQQSSKRIIATAPQATIPATLRQQNIKNAFRASTVPYSYIAIVDDIFTTGHTAAELSKQFKLQGIEEIHVWCCARAIPKNLG